jgi:hypothetical protein
VPVVAAANVAAAELAAPPAGNGPTAAAAAGLDGQLAGLTISSNGPVTHLGSSSPGSGPAAAVAAAGSPVPGLAGSIGPAPAGTAAAAAGGYLAAMPPPPPQQQGTPGISAIFRNATSTLLEAGEPRVCRWGVLLCRPCVMCRFSFVAAIVRLFRHCRPNVSLHACMGPVRPCYMHKDHY